MTNSTRTAGITLFVGAIVGLASCENALGPSGEKQASLSFGVAATADATATDTLECTDGTHTLRIEQVLVAFADVELQRAGDSGDASGSDTDSDTDTDSDGAHDESLHSGPVTVELPLQGGVVTPIQQSVPLGSYDEIELEVEHVRVRGSYDGSPFDVVLLVPVDVELELQPPFVVASGTERANITVMVDPCDWFRIAGGTLVNPDAVKTDDALRELVRHRISASFRAFEDRDQDGDDADSDTDTDG